MKIFLQGILFFIEILLLGFRGDVFLLCFPFSLQPARSSSLAWFCCCVFSLSFSSIFLLFLIQLFPSSSSLSVLSFFLVFPYLICLFISSFFFQKKLYFRDFSKPFFLATMAVRAQFEHSSDVGVFARLTSKYAVVAMGGAEQFKVLETELQDKIPVVRTSLAGTRVVGRLCVGNRHGLLVPNTTTNQELQVQSRFSRPSSCHSFSWPFLFPAYSQLPS
jgi:hypothetical protein